MRGRFAGLLASVVVLVLGLSAVSAEAQVADADADRRARQHFESGTAYFEVGDWDNALHEFSSAYEASGRIELLYNVYLTYERMGNLTQAIAFLERYLESDVDTHRGTLERRLENLRARVHRGETGTGSEGDSHTGEDLAALPELEGDTVVTRSTEGPSVTTPPRETSGSVSPVAFVGVGIAAAGLVGLGVSGGLTLSEDARLRACAPGCARSETDTIALTAPLTDAFAGLALVGAIVGIIGLVLPGDASDSNAALRVTPIAGPGTLGAHLEGSF